MSITFYLSKVGNDGEWNPACRARHFICSYNCEEYQQYRYCGHCIESENNCPICSLSVNMANINAKLVIERLGIEFDSCGHIDPAELLGRAMTANVGRDDSGTANSTYHGAGGATIVDCGLPPNYFEERFGDLADLAIKAMNEGFIIVWS